MEAAHAARVANATFAHVLCRVAAKVANAIVQVTAARPAAEKLHRHAAVKKRELAAQAKLPKQLAVQATRRRALAVPAKAKRLLVQKVNALEPAAARKIAKAAIFATPVPKRQSAAKILLLKSLQPSLRNRRKAFA